MLMFGLNETMGKLAMANSVCWYGHVLRRENGHVLISSLDYEVHSQTKKWRLKKTWKKQGVEVGLSREDVLCQSKWSVGINLISSRLRSIWPPSLV